MSQRTPAYSLKPNIRTNKNFIYNGKKYPIDFSLIKKNSNYFYQRRDQFKNVEDIILTQEPIDISDDSIRCFISSCHNEFFDINDSNAFSLYQLSIRYDVPCLYSLADDYIRKHDKSLVFQSIQYKFMLMNQNSDENSNSISIENDEEKIATNFFEYINSEQLIDLPIPVLYRIINNPKLKINELNETNKNLLIDFLFKCLKKYKKPASVLFLNLDLENQRIELFSKLQSQFSNDFDFSMINSKFLLKTTTDLLSELAKLKENYSSSINQVNQLLEQIKDEKNNQQKLIESFKNYAQGQINKELENLRNSFNNLQKQINYKVQNLNNSFEDFKKNIYDDGKKLNNSFEIFQKQINDEERKLQNDAAKNVYEMKELINQNNRKISTFITKDI